MRYSDNESMHDCDDLLIVLYMYAYYTPLC